VGSIETAIRNWQDAGVNLLEPNEEAAVRTALDGINRKYSRDVVALYRLTGGMNRGDDDTRFWALWSLPQIVSENARYNRPHILFADFLINSHFYCFRYENPEESAVCIDYFNGEEPEAVARSVDEFFDLYVNHHGKLAMFD
jgi:hypothetical protein